MKRHHALGISITVGPLAGWVALLETGLIHSRGPAAAFAQGLVLSLAISLTWILARTYKP